MTHTRLWYYSQSEYNYGWLETVNHASWSDGITVDSIFVRQLKKRTKLGLRNLVHTMTLKQRGVSVTLGSEGQGRRGRKMSAWSSSSVCLVMIITCVELRASDQSCPWVTFPWPDPTRPDPLKFGPDPSWPTDEDNIYDPTRPDPPTPFLSCRGKSDKSKN